MGRAILGARRLMTDQELLRDIGAALYGPHWHAALAHDLDVSWRTMRRWIAGEAVPPRVWGELKELLSARMLLFERAIEALRRLKPP